MAKKKKTEEVVEEPLVKETVKVETPKVELEPEPVVEETQPLPEYVTDPYGTPKTQDEETYPDGTPKVQKEIENIAERQTELRTEAKAITKAETNIEENKTPPIQENNSVGQSISQEQIDILKEENDLKYMANQENQPFNHPY